MHEFAALGLSKMSQDFSSKVTIFESDGLESLIRCLSSSDPDVQKNSLETIALMLQVIISKTYNLYFQIKDNVCCIHNVILNFFFFIFRYICLDNFNH